MEKGNNMNEYDKRAFFWFREAAKKADAETQYQIGVNYYKGDPDIRASIFARQGIKEGSQYSGYSPVSSWGIDAEEYLKALYWLTKAAEQGHAKAQSDLGRLYENGWRGDVVDGDKAKYWYEKAAEQGDAYARYILGEMALEDDDDLQAFTFYMKAATEGCSEAQVRVGEFYCTYHYEMGIDKDDSKAAEWFEKAAEQGNGEGAYWLGLHYKDGNGIEQDREKAIYWLKKSIEEFDTPVVRNALAEAELIGTTADDDDDDDDGYDDDDDYDDNDYDNDDDEG